MAGTRPHRVESVDPYLGEVTRAALWIGLRQRTLTDALTRAPLRVLDRMHQVQIPDRPTPLQVLRAESDAIVSAGTPYELVAYGQMLDSGLRRTLLRTADIIRHMPQDYLEQLPLTPFLSPDWRERDRQSMIDGICGNVERFAETLGDGELRKLSRGAEALEGPGAHLTLETDRDHRGHVNVRIGDQEARAS